MNIFQYVIVLVYLFDTNALRRHTFPQKQLNREINCDMDAIYRGTNIYPRLSITFKNSKCLERSNGSMDLDQQGITQNIQKEISTTTAASDTDYVRMDTFDVTDAKRTVIFLVKASLIGISTGLGVKVFKSSIDLAAAFFFESFADILPKPAFYWPLGLFPLFGSVFVAFLVFIRGNTIYNGIDYIAKSIDANSIFLKSTIDTTLFQNTSTGVTILPSNKEQSIISPLSFDPVNQLIRLIAAVFTLGSGCSLGPEGPSVELGAGFSRMIAGTNATTKEQHHLFLAGTAAGVSAGFSAPIAGILFAIECGNRYLSKNTIMLDEDAPDGPRSDIAAISLAATLASIMVHVGGGSVESLRIQGNSFAMQSPGFELPMYLGLGLLSGIVSVSFTSLKDILTNLFKPLHILENSTSSSSGILEDQTIDIIQQNQQNYNHNHSNSISNSNSNSIELYSSYRLSDIPLFVRPLLGGGVCGLAAIFYPQSLFTGYSTLDELLAGNYHFDLPLLLQILFIKITLSAVALASGLIGGVFAPSLFFGAAVGTAYHQIIIYSISNLLEIIRSVGGDDLATSASQFMIVANAPAYATVGAAATLGALFRAPLTSSMLMFELTQNHEIVLPVLASTGLAGLFAEILSHPRKLW